MIGNISMIQLLIYHPVYILCSLFYCRQLSTVKQKCISQKKCRRYTRTSETCIMIMLCPSNPLALFEQRPVKATEGFLHACFQLLAHRFQQLRFVSALQMANVLRILTLTLQTNVDISELFYFIHSVFPFKINGFMLNAICICSVCVCVCSQDRERGTWRVDMGRLFFK